MLQRQNFNRIILAFALTMTSLLVGMGGFMLIEHYTVSEAFYMTVTTVSTVGYGQLHPFSATGRLFVSFYILYNLLWAQWPAGLPGAARQRRPRGGY